MFRNLCTLYHSAVIILKKYKLYIMIMYIKINWLLKVKQVIQKNFEGRQKKNLLLNGDEKE